MLRRSTPRLLNADVTITRLQGVCRTEANRVIFCDGALPGETLLAAVTEEKKGEPAEQAPQCLTVPNGALTICCPCSGL